MNISEVLSEAIKDYKVDLTDSQYDKFEKYYNLLLEWNNKINLTAITDVEGVAIKHFADSLSLLNYINIPENASVIDIGTGAGFPGIVLKIARPDIKLTLMDSLNKRLIFLDEVLKNIGLQADLVHSRAEDNAKSGSEYREKFDFAVSRAVAKMNVLAEYCLPYVKVGGNFIAMKGPGAEAEIDEAKKAVGILGGKTEDVFNFKLPSNGDCRNIVKILKVKQTPIKYPRNSGKIKSNPL